NGLGFGSAEDWPRSLPPVRRPVAGRFPGQVAWQSSTQTVGIGAQTGPSLVPPGTVGHWPRCHRFRSARFEADRSVRFYTWPTVAATIDESIRRPRAVCRRIPLFDWRPIVLALFRHRTMRQTAAEDSASSVPRWSGYGS